MAGNVSFILNLLLFIGVIVAIICLVRARRQAKTVPTMQPALGNMEMKNFDDIIAVRKIIVDDEKNSIPQKEIEPLVQAAAEAPQDIPDEPAMKPLQNLMLFLVAKEDRHLAGYELLQTLLASNLRFGEGNLFHRHEHPNGQGAILCSLAAATPSGMFDLQNIGAFSVKGLCLFMQASGNTAVDALRLQTMLQTANLLSEGLDTRLLDFQKQHFTEETVSRYRRLLNLTKAEA